MRKAVRAFRGADVIKVETLVIGAGLIGSSVAMHLARLGAGSVRVVDFDLEGSLSSSELNAGGVRGTWIQPVNIACSKLSIDYFASVADEVGYRACGYLWLRQPTRMEFALKARERQLSMGWPVEAWDVAELRRKVPFIDKTDDLAGAIFGPRDGLINPNLLKLHYRDLAKNAGVVFDDRTLVRDVEYGESGAASVSCERFADSLLPEEKQRVLTEESHGVVSSKVVFHAERVINCAGPWAPDVAHILRYPCPSRPIRRQVSIFDCRDVDLTPYGMVIDTSGVYFHPEAMNGLAGVTDPNEPPGKNYQYDGESFFTDYIWPALYERSSGFERLKHLTGWAGLYEVSPDESAIIGQVEHGEAGKSGRVFECHSFSGHGVMHSYAVGLGLAERILKGKYESIDLSELAAKRFENGRLLKETWVI